MNLFCDSVPGAEPEEFDSTFSNTQAEIWYDDQNGRVYDVIEI